ncbi:MAG TPA: hypothetical protein VEV44_19180 [Pseudoneobacillus sp.]|nr:hypothetical protein [Pseudoneobacillus sp.]
MYIGNGAYCYANSASMLIKGIGEDIPPSLLEVLSGVGLGVTLYGNGNLFLHNNTIDPDRGITNAMRSLGFSFDEKFSDADVETPPIAELREVLKTSTAILGPVDMGYLKYSPNHMYAKGSDHYVLAYHMDDKYIYVHDPASFPYVRLAHDSLDLAWKAADLPYGRGRYQYWHSIKRVSNPSKEEVYQESLRFFQHLYEETGEIGATIGAKTGKDAIMAFSEKLVNNEMSQELAGNLKYFVLQLGAKRANDYSLYFEKYNPILSKLKRKQSEILGLCHSFAAEEDWKGLSTVFQEFGKIEEEFEGEVRNLNVYSA